MIISYKTLPHVSLIALGTSTSCEVTKAVTTEAHAKTVEIPIIKI